MYEYTLNIDRISKRPYLVKEEKVDYLKTRRMNSPDRIVEFMNHAYRLADKAEEWLYLITMNAKCDVTGVFLVGKGTATLCLAGVNEIMARALLAGARAMVLVHNHPSGDPTPSKEDLKLTRNLAGAGKIMQVVLHDSIIVGDCTYYSVNQECPEELEPEVPDWAKW